MLDSPAGLHGKNLGHALKAARKVLVPMQPSLFDVAAARDFLRALTEEKAVRRHCASVGIIGVRVDARTKAAATLGAFLTQYDLPVLGFLRDTQIYPNAAFTGRSVFDLSHSVIERELAQWKGILHWITTPSLV